MSKSELKTLYKLGKITSKEYFLELCRLLRAEAPITEIKIEHITPEDDYLKVFDGKLPDLDSFSA